MRKRLWAFVAFLLGLRCGVLAAVGFADGHAGVGGRPIIVFMTDFGTANDAVAICRR